MFTPNMMKTRILLMNLMKSALFGAFIFTLVELTSCSSDLDDGNIPNADPIRLELTEKIETDNSFALDLFRTTCQSSEKSTNVFISPLSVNMALSMAMNGASGETLKEMKEALRAENYSMDAINNFNKTLRTALLKVDPTTNIFIANSIWYRNTLTVKNDFISVNKDYYDAEVKALDFSSPNAIKQINDWVSDNTNKKIPEIMNRIDPLNVMCLINAIYFKGIWENKFKKSDTVDEYFYSEDNLNRKEVKMMKQSNSFLYFEDDTCRYLKMRYGNAAFSMIVMLPQDNRTVDDVISNLNNKSWAVFKWVKSYKVNLQLPRFKAVCSYQMEESILPAMGMKIPFSKNDADYSGITDTPFFISEVIHKTLVDVNEEGTEAVTITIKKGDWGAPPPETLIDYVVNKPFAFAICENSTGIILFMGKMIEIN